MNSATKLDMNDWRDRVKSLHALMLGAPASSAIKIITQIEDICRYWQCPRNKAENGKEQV